MDALQAVGGWPAENVSVGVVSTGGPVATLGDRGHEYEWASVTKPVSALACLVAAEEGTLDLDEPAGPPGSTVRHLLAHASGLPPGLEAPSAKPSAPGRKSGAPPAPGLEAPSAKPSAPGRKSGAPPAPLEGTSPIARPGERRIYSDQGFDVLGEVLAQHAEMNFADYLDAAVLKPLRLAARFEGRPGSGLHGSLDDLLAVARELLAPTLISAETLAEATAVAFPGLIGVLPGFGRQEPNDWGLGFELRDRKSPHWTGMRNSERTFGHFGRSGTFLWVDPDAGVALGCLTDLTFGDWAAKAWPPLSDGVLSELGR